MTGVDQSNGPDPEEAVALEIGMSLLQARRIASEAIAEAERRAREFVTAPDFRVTDLISGVGSSGSLRRGSETRPEEIDLRSLAAQVDEIEETLLSCHQRILRLFDDVSADDVSAGDDVSADEEDSPRVEDSSSDDVSSDRDAPSEFAPPADSRAQVAADATVVAPTGSSCFVPTEPEPAPARESVPLRHSAPRPATAPSNGAGAHPAPWGPPDPSSRVSVPAGDAAGEQYAPPAEQPVGRSEATLDDGTDAPEHAAPRSVEQPETQFAGSPVSWPDAPEMPQDLTTWRSADRATGSSRVYADTAAPAGRTSSTLWLLNVVGFSVLLIVVVVVLMLANVL